MTSKTQSFRRYDIDWLRNLGILLLFPYHSSRVFDHWDPFYVKSHELSWGLSWFISITSLWFMPLLFWLAGSASWYALRVRSNQVYINDRYKRLFIPLIFGVLFIVPPQGYFSTWWHKGDVGSYFVFLKTFFTDFSDLSGYFGTFTPAHLWFILYLFILSLVALPFFNFFKNPKRAAAITKFNTVSSNPVVFVLFFILLFLTQPLPAPGGQNPFYFLVIFVMGFITASHAGYQEMFNRIRFKALILLIVSITAWILIMELNPPAAKFSSLDISIAALRTLNTWLSLIVLLGYGNKFLNFQHKWLPYMNEAAFPIYIIHQSVLVIIAFYVLKLKTFIFIEYVLILVLTLVASIAIYEFIIKRTPVTRWLFGVKIKINEKKVNKAKASADMN